MKIRAVVVVVVVIVVFIVVAVVVVVVFELLLKTNSDEISRFLASLVVRIKAQLYSVNHDKLPKCFYFLQVSWVVIQHQAG